MPKEGGIILKERILDTAHLEKIRRKKRMRKIRAAVVLCLILVVILVWLTGIGSLYVTRVSDFLETVELRMRTGTGFPVPLVMGTETQGGSMTAAAVLMDEKEVFVYSDTGSALRNFQHGYARPGLTVGNTRFCVYNQGGKGSTQRYGHHITLLGQLVAVTATIGAFCCAFTFFRSVG